MSINTLGRHPATAHVAQLFAYEHIAHTEAREIAHAFYSFVELLLDTIDDGPELTVTLRKLVEAKDAACRAVIYGDGTDG